MLAVFLYFGMSCCVVGPALGTLGPTSFVTMGTRSVALREGRELYASLEADAVSDFVGNVLSPQPFVRLAAACPEAEDELHLRYDLLKRLNEDDAELQARLAATTVLGRNMYEQFLQGVEQRQASGLSDTGLPKPTSAADRRSAVRFWIARQEITAVMDIVMTAAGVFLLVGGLLVLMFFAGVFKGGLSYYLLGLALVRADGSRAGWWRCVWRNLVTWAPPFALLMAAAVLESWYWSVAAPADRQAWLLGLVTVVRWAGILLVVTYPLLAIAFPRRSLNDKLAGTHIVPF
jgi:hypothetical protein